MVVERKSKETLQAFFNELGPERRAAIESMAIDISQALISAVKESIPQARLVLDRFLVQRLV